MAAAVLVVVGSEDYRQIKLRGGNLMDTICFYTKELCINNGIYPLPCQYCPNNPNV